MIFCKVLLALFGMAIIAGYIRARHRDHTAPARMEAEYLRLLLMICAQVTHENWQTYQELISGFYNEYAGTIGVNDKTNKLEKALIDTLDKQNPIIYN